MTDNPEKAIPDIHLWLDHEGAAAMRELGVRAGHRVLDFGCGAGPYVVPLAQAVAPNGLVIAADTDPGALERLRERLSSACAAGEVRLVRLCGDAPLRDIPDGSLDAVFLFDVLQHVPDWDALFREAARMVKPGGCAYVYPAAVPHPGVIKMDRLIECLAEHAFVSCARRRLRLAHANTILDDEVHIFERRREQADRIGVRS